MATTRLTASNGFYGHSGNGSYTNSAANHLFVGKSPSTSNYRSRMTFPSLRSAANIGDSRIEITKMVLHLYRNDGGPTTVTAGSSSSSAWGAVRAGTGSAEIGASSGWKSIDVTACAEAVAGYTGNWYMHLTGSADHRIRFNGTGGSNKPYLDVTWEYLATTIKSNKDLVTLGDSVTFAITREENDASAVLEYSIGEASGTIGGLSYAEGDGGGGVRWAPEVRLASEITDDDMGTVEIRMKVYDSNGTLLRTERYYQTVVVPQKLSPVVSDLGAKLENGLEGYTLTGLVSYGLTGRSFFSLAPVIDMNNSFGATVASVTATITNGSSEQSVSWTEFTESDDGGEFYCASVQSAVLTEAGSSAITLTVTDSRGMTTSATNQWTVCDYAPPAISTFSAERYSPVYDANEEIGGYEADDLGGHVWINLEASVSEVAPAGTQLNALAWRIDAVNPTTGEMQSVYGDGAQVLIFVQERTLFPDAVSEGDTWNYTLTLTDTAGGSATQYTSVQPGWANFALAASRRGAAFGGIPHGTAASPMLESWYPLYAYEGIHGVNRYEAGETDTGGVWIDGRKIYRQVFSGNVAGGTTNDVLLGAIPELASVVRMQGMFVRTGDSSRFVHPIPYYNSATRYFLPFCNPATGEFFVQATHAGTVHLIVDYTKYKQGEFSILVQPTDIQAVGGDTVTFEVVAVGAVSYQWQVGGTDGTNWTDLTWTGAETASMTHTMNDTNIKYVYRCKLTGADGEVLYTNTIRFI